MSSHDSNIVEDIIDQYQFAMNFYHFCSPLHYLRDEHNFRICCGDMPTKTDVVSVIFPTKKDGRPGCGFNGQDLCNFLFDEDPCVAILYGINSAAPDKSEVLAIGALIATTFEDFGFVVDKPSDPSKCVLVYPARERTPLN